MKVLSKEIDTLRTRVLDLEKDFERKLEQALEKATEKMKTRISKSSASSPAGHAGVDAQTRYRMIAEAAYLRAERRGFSGGDPEQDWVEAEREVDEALLHGMPETNTRKRPGKTGQRQSGRA